MTFQYINSGQKPERKDDMDETNADTNPSAVENDRQGGGQIPENASTRSPAQAEASRRNGAKSGGRPRGSGMKLVKWLDIKRKAGEGLSQKKAAAALHVSPRTLRRRLREMDAW